MWFCGTKIFVFVESFRSPNPTTFCGRNRSLCQTVNCGTCAAPLKQSEDRLRAENAALSAQLQERQIHIENAGSIAQAALELNKVFEAAQAAADEYVASVLAANKNTDAAASALRAQAEAEAQQILAQAQTEAASLKARTQQQCDAETEAAARKRAQTEADCKAMLARTQQEIQQRRAAFDRRASELLDGYHSTEFLPEERAK